ncbi:MAG: bifunctional folylpolyglutamate synthase/dihydrofolate synthase, partial [Burkholderiaceae bacterium]|nr:bifunctional folylpolyglutamate synthase/dihydrofolate synthase [Burkholderiaceae bacterium]
MASSTSQVGTALPPGASLGRWLTYIEHLHDRPIELGLERVALVARRLDLHLTSPVITVGGTNGKGSTCAFLEAMLAAAGYRVANYTSPHLVRFNERARLGGAALSDELLVAQLERVEAARGEVSLTYFEFTTLAILALFQQEGPDVVILEVGLGG